MADKSVTLSIGITSASYALPTQPDGMIALKNIGANVIWISHKEGTAAALEGDECEPILAGETVYIMWKALPLVAIAATATTKLVATGAIGRM